MFNIFGVIVKFWDSKIKISFFTYLIHFIWFKAVAVCCEIDILVLRLQQNPQTVVIVVTQMLIGKRLLFNSAPWLQQSYSNMLIHIRGRVCVSCSDLDVRIAVS